MYNVHISPWSFVICQPYLDLQSLVLRLTALMVNSNAGSRLYRSCISSQACLLDCPGAFSAQLNVRIAVSHVRCMFQLLIDIYSLIIFTLISLRSTGI